MHRPMWEKGGIIYALHSDVYTIDEAWEEIDKI